jgi:hypothetical protein
MARASTPQRVSQQTWRHNFLVPEVGLEPTRRVNPRGTLSPPAKTHLRGTYWFIKKSSRLIREPGPILGPISPLMGTISGTFPYGSSPHFSKFNPSHTPAQPPPPTS